MRVKNQDLTVGKPSRVLWNFCLPLFGSILFQQLYNIADSFVAGQFLGEDALAAVGNSYEVTLIFIAFAFGCNIGCSVVVSHLFGSRNHRDLKTAVSTTLIAGGVLCAFLMLAGFLFGKELLRLIQTPATVIEDSWVYLRIYTLSLPFVFYYNIATGIFSALGDSKTPFFFLACSSLANIGADILFVTAFHRGVDGVAWATLICQGVSCILAIMFVFLRLKGIETEGHVPAFSWRLLGRVAVVAVPSILQQSFISVGNIIIQSVINGFGKGVMAGYSAAVKLNNLMITSLTTVGNGISNYTAQNLGAGKGERIREGFRAGVKLMWSLCLPIVILYLCGSNFLVRIFLDHPSAEASQAGMMFLRIVSPFYFVIAMKLTADGILRGSGQMGQFMVATCVDLVMRVVLAALLSRPFETNGIWMAWPISWIVAAVLSYIFYRRGKWDKPEKAESHREKEEDI